MSCRSSGPFLASLARRVRGCDELAGDSRDDHFVWYSCAKHLKPFHLITNQFSRISGSVGSSFRWDPCEFVGALARFCIPLKVRYARMQLVQERQEQALLIGGQILQQNLLAIIRQLTHTVKKSSTAWGHCVRAGASGKSTGNCCDMPEGIELSHSPANAGSVYPQERDNFDRTSASDRTLGTERSKDAPIRKGAKPFRSR